ncbi:MAG TPA: transketolase [Candidatus Nanoarchaeia archaeon]|nr:transketolase [Candidatus Nanoarchaeia archaeon]
MDIIQKLESKAKQHRKEIIQMVYDAQSGHPGGSLSAIDIITALYGYKLKFNPKKPDWPDRDRFVYSKGHACPALYAVLADHGYFSKGEFKKFRKLGGMLQGHADRKWTPGVEFSAGSLGQGLGFAIGIALAGRLDKKNYKVYCMIGDGECEEGAVWEGAMAAAQFKLKNLIAIMDSNKVQQTGKVKDIMNLEPIEAKWKAFGWRTIAINGHNMKDIVSALDSAVKDDGRPSIIIANTIKGKGVSFMELNEKFHGKAPNDEEYKKAMGELNA